jgi:hypothetical protein
MDIKDTFRFVAPRVRDAAVKTAEQLNHLGIRYALAGGFVELVKAGADLTLVRDYLKQYAGDLVPLFEELVNEALAE